MSPSLPQTRGIDIGMNRVEWRKTGHAEKRKEGRKLGGRKGIFECFRAPKVARNCIVGLSPTLHPPCLALGEQKIYWAQESRRRGKPIPGSGPPWSAAGGPKPPERINDLRLSIFRLLHPSGCRTVVVCVPDDIRPFHNNLESF